MFKLVILSSLLSAFSLATLVASDEGGAPLADAMEAQQVSEVERMIRSGADVNQTQPEGSTALIWAAYHGQSKLVDLLLQNGADPLAQNQFGVQAISMACQAGDIESVESLLKAGVPVETTSHGAVTLLMMAARNGNPELVDVLLKAGAVVDAQSAFGEQTALMWAAAEGHLEVVDALLEAGANPQAVTESGFTTMHFAARGGHIAVVERMLEAGVAVDVRMKWKGRGLKYRSPMKQSTPLTLALENAHFELVIELLKAGADPNDMGTNFAPLHTMTWVRRADIGDGSDPEPPVRGKVSSLECIRALVEHGADPNIQLKKKVGKSRFNGTGATPFFLAAQRSDVAMMRLLVELGADPTITNITNTTPLLIAAGIGRGPEQDEAGTEDEAVAAVAYCLELGLDVNHVDNNKDTAMHGAAYGQWPKMVNFLHKNGADIKVWHTLNSRKTSPLLIANGHRPGNLKIAYTTIAALEALLDAARISHRYPAPKGKKKGY